MKRRPLIPAYLFSSQSLNLLQTNYVSKTPIVAMVTTSGSLQNDRVPDAALPSNKLCTSSFAHAAHYQTFVPVSLTDRR